MSIEMFQPSPPKRDSPARTSTRIHSLDGLRPISISMVLVGYAFSTEGFSRGRNKSAAKVALLILGNGGLGVQVSFVISGFLITTLLLNELSLSRCVDLKHFYIRGIFRIFAAYYAMIVIVSLLSQFGIDRVSSEG